MSDVTIIGMDEVLKKLKILPERVQKNVLVGAIRASTKPIIKEARALVPKNTGTLRKSITAKKRRSHDKNIIQFSIYPSTSGKNNGWYGRFVEFGTENMAAKPFMRPSFESAGEDSLKVAKDYMRKRIDKEIAKL